MELHRVKGLAFAKQADPKGHISVFAYQEGSPGEDTRFTKIGHFDPGSNRLYLAGGMLSPHRQPIETGPDIEAKFQRLPFEEVADYQAHYEARVARDKKRRDEMQQEQAQQQSVKEALGVDNITKGPVKADGHATDEQPPAPVVDEVKPPADTSQVEAPPPETPPPALETQPAPEVAASQGEETPPEAPPAADQPQQ